MHKLNAFTEDFCHDAATRFLGSCFWLAACSLSVSPNAFGNVAPRCLSRRERAVVRLQIFSTPSHPLAPASEELSLTSLATVLAKRDLYRLRALAGALGKNHPWPQATQHPCSRGEQVSSAVSSQLDLLWFIDARYQPKSLMYWQASWYEKVGEREVLLVFLVSFTFRRKK